MGNMSYCRFENTNGDIRECIAALEEREISSASERKAAQSMLLDILDYCQGEDIIQGYDIDRLKEVIAECGKMYEGEAE